MYWVCLSHLFSCWTSFYSLFSQPSISTSILSLLPSSSFTLLSVFILCAHCLFLLTPSSSSLLFSLHEAVIHLNLPLLCRPAFAFAFPLSPRPFTPLPSIFFTCGFLRILPFLLPQTSLLRRRPSSFFSPVLPFDFLYRPFQPSPHLTVRCASVVLPANKKQIHAYRKLENIYALKILSSDSISVLEGLVLGLDLFLLLDFKLVG